MASVPEWIAYPACSSFCGRSPVVILRDVRPLKIIFSSIPLIKLPYSDENFKLKTLCLDNSRANRKFFLIPKYLCFSNPKTDLILNFLASVQECKSFICGSIYILKGYSQWAEIWYNDNINKLQLCASFLVQTIYWQ